MDAWFSSCQDWCCDAYIIDHVLILSPPPLQGKEDSDYGYMGISRVEILNTTTGAFGLFSLEQYVYSWNGLSSFDKAPSDTCYTVSVSTASLTKAIVFDGEVHLKVHGDKGTSEEMRLQNWWSSGFQVGGGGGGGAVGTQGMGRGHRLLGG